VSGVSLFTGDYWLSVSDGDRRALALFHRHYSYHQYKDGRRPTLFVGPGEKLVLLTSDCDALFIWRKFRSMDNQPGVNCSVFRNESAVQSSVLIREAMEWAWRKWPGERLYTYVKTDALRTANNNPGCCFKKAGWRQCGLTKVHRLLIFEVQP
jgi:hypothetical protein